MLPNGVEGFSEMGGDGCVVAARRRASEFGGVVAWRRSGGVAAW